MRRSLMLAVAVAVLWSVQAWAQYTYTQVDVPFAGQGQTKITGLGDGGSMAGTFRDPNGVEQGWQYMHKQNRWVVLKQSGFPGLMVEDLNRQGDTAGHYIKKGKGYAFLRTSCCGTKTISVPGAAVTWGFGLSDSRELVGSALWPDGEVIAYWYDAVANWRLDIQVPGAWYTEFHGVNNSGDAVGVYQDATGTHGLLMRHPMVQDFFPIDAPCGGNWTIVVDINDNDEMAVLCGQDDFLVKNYVYMGDVTPEALADPSNWTELWVPDSDFTQVTRINNKGQVGGFFIDGNGAQHGFVASPTAAMVQAVER
jgi:hypothetical protein